MAPSLYLRVPLFVTWVPVSRSNSPQLLRATSPSLTIWWPWFMTASALLTPVMTLVALAHGGPSPQSVPGPPHVRGPLPTPSQAVFPAVVLGFPRLPPSETAEPRPPPHPQALPAFRALSLGSGNLDEPHLWAACSPVPRHCPSMSTSLYMTRASCSSSSPAPSKNRLEPGGGGAQL